MKGSVVAKISSSEAIRLMTKVRETAGTLSPTDIEVVEENLEIIGSEAKNDTPKKNIVKLALRGLQAIKGTAEFSAAVTTLVQFFQGIL